MRPLQEGKRYLSRPLGPNIVWICLCFVWPITITLLCTFGLSIGLTFRSNHHCYAGVCGEWLFPLQARVHVIIWYSWISISVTCLAVRAFSSEVRRILRHSLSEKKIPLLGKHFAVSGILIFCWIILLYGAIVGVWWIRLRDYFVQRGLDNGIAVGNHRLAAIALTGHLADVTMGMVLLPISRHSALASFFKLSVSTTLTFHMLAAYTLFILVLAHGFLYVAWIPVFQGFTSTLRQVYPVFNPTYHYHEVWPGSTSSLGLWRASLPWTGLFTTVIMCLIFLTTFPQIRQKHFNLFYFTHLTVIVGVIVICLHASTMFYCTAPGLVLWLVDWGMRVYELKQEVEGHVIALGNGYYSLSMPMPRRRLKGCACTSPLAHFYIYHSDSSIRELHPFTTITHLASENYKTPKEQDDITIQFLFRKRSRARALPEIPLADNTGLAQMARVLMSPKKKTKFQWTEKLASHADKELAYLSFSSSVLSLVTPISDGSCPSRRYSAAPVYLRLEGPYFTPANPSLYKTVICLVAGTGISGGIAIANAFMEAERQRDDKTLCAANGGNCQAKAALAPWERCVVVWSVREDDFVELPFFQTNPNSALEFRVQLTGNGRPRMDFAKTLGDIVPSVSKGPTWVYLSGPNLFIKSGEEACKAAGMDWYGARWEI